MPITLNKDKMLELVEDGGSAHYDEQQGPTTFSVQGQPSTVHDQVHKQLDILLQSLALRGEFIENPAVDDICLRTCQECGVIYYGDAECVSCGHYNDYEPQDDGQDDEQDDGQSDVLDTTPTPIQAKFLSLVTVDHVKALDRLYDGVKGELCSIGGVQTDAVLRKNDDELAEYLVSLQFRDLPEFVYDEYRESANYPTEELISLLKSCVLPSTAPGAVFLGTVVVLDLDALDNLDVLELAQLFAQHVRPGTPIPEWVTEALSS